MISELNRSCPRVLQTARPRRMGSGENGQRCFRPGSVRLQPRRQRQGSNHRFAPPSFFGCRPGRRRRHTETTLRQPDQRLLRQAAVTALRERFERAVQDGDLPVGTDCATLARYTATVLNGLAVQAASGATEKELRLVSALAMQAWPSWDSKTAAMSRRNKKADGSKQRDPSAKGALALTPPYESARQRRFLQSLEKR